MVDRYTKVVLTLIAVGLWLQVGMQFNLVGQARASYHDQVNYENYLDQIELNTGNSIYWLKQVHEAVLYN